MERKTIDKHVGNFNIAGFTYWEACTVLGELKRGVYPLS